MQTNDMDTIELDQIIGTGGTIAVTQTTFVEISANDKLSTRYRVHFGRALRRTRLKGSFEVFCASNDHPLCLAFEKCDSSISIHAGPKDFHGFIEGIEYACDSVFEGWISIEEYLNPYFSTPETLGPTATGELMRAPSTLISAIAPVLKEYCVQYTVFERDAEKLGVWAITFDSMHVVADSVTIERCNN